MAVRGGHHLFMSDPPGCGKNFTCGNILLITFDCYFYV
ncbi:ATP-binding protein [Aquibacillus saliphilus]